MLDPDVAVLDDTLKPYRLTYDDLFKTGNEEAVEAAKPALVNLFPNLTSIKVRRDLVQVTDLPPSLSLSQIRELRPALEEQPTPQLCSFGYSLADSLRTSVKESHFEEVRDLLLDSVYGRVRCQLPYALARIKSRRTDTIQLLMQILSGGHGDGHREVFSQSLHVLRLLNATEATVVIEGHASSDDELIRKEARKALQKFNG